MELVEQLTILADIFYIEVNRLKKIIVMLLLFCYFISFGDNCASKNSLC